MSITKRESGNAVVFEAPNAGVVAICTQGVCYVNPFCTQGIKSSISTLVPNDTLIEETPTQAEFLELLAKKAR